MNKADEIRQAHATIKKLINGKSPWLEGKEREFAVVKDVLWKMKCERAEREAHFRRKDKDGHD